MSGKPSWVDLLIEDFRSTFLRFLEKAEAVQVEQRDLISLYEKSEAKVKVLTQGIRDLSSQRDELEKEVQRLNGIIANLTPDSVRRK
ncbi:hypothetical protein [Glycocaulis sp.]|uniref:hypothetical protein n=1 Tax=Glycocaulis sp. TaxID=1969725 RepID=UPI003F6EB548